MAEYNLAIMRNENEMHTAQEDVGRKADVAAYYAGAADAYIESYSGWGTAARFYRSRMTLVGRTVSTLPEGRLLDAGCGPGMIVQEIVRERPGHFRITALDSSPSMVDACTARTRGVGDVEAVVGDVEAMAFPDGWFDVVLAMGVLEYVDTARALGEIARVTRPGGLAVVTMLNPGSPYRIVEWHLKSPLGRALRAVEALVGVPAVRRHGGGPPSAIRAHGPRTMRSMMSGVGLRPVDVAYFDVTPLVPPFDRVVRRWARRWQHRPETTVSRGVLRTLGTAYMIAAVRDRTPASSRPG